MSQPRSLLPGLTEAIIQQHAGSTVFSRGEVYARQDVVTALVLRGNTLTAAVHGSEYEPYRVLVHFDNGDLTNLDCTCPVVGHTNPAQGLAGRNDHPVGRSVPCRRPYRRQRECRKDHAAPYHPSRRKRRPAYRVQRRCARCRQPHARLIACHGRNQSGL